jgi:hypothetical protein
MFHKADSSSRAWSGDPPLVLLLVTDTGQIAICTLRSLRRIQRWNVADLAVHFLVLPTPFASSSAMVPGSAILCCSAYQAADMPILIAIIAGGIYYPCSPSKD